MSIVTYDDLDTPVFEIDFLRYLSPIAWYDLQPPNIYADTSLSSPAVIAGGIAGIGDLSGNGYNATQPTSTARPILGRVPVGGRRNLLTYTEDFGSAAWQKLNSTPVASGFRETVANGAHFVRYHVAYADGVYSFTASVKGIGRSRAYLIFETASAFTNRASVFVDLVAGTSDNLVTSGTFSGTTVLVGDLDADGYRELTISGNTGAKGGSGNIIAGIYSALAGATINFVGETDKGLDIKVTQVERSLTPTPYQRVGSEYDITEAGVPSIYYARYDGADDVLPANLTIPPITNGTFILVGSNGVFIDSEYTNTTLSLSFGPTTYTGGPEGILAVVGDLLAFGFLDRQLTESEVDKVRAAGVKRGAAGWFVAGEELLESSSPSGDGWAASGATVSGDDITFTASNGRATNQVTTESGIAYLYRFDAQIVSGNTTLHPYYFGSKSGNFAAHNFGVRQRFSAALLGREGGGPVEFGLADRNSSGFGTARMTAVTVRKLTLVTP